MIDYRFLLQIKKNILKKVNHMCMTWALHTFKLVKLMCTFNKNLFQLCIH